jgi:hypothetical protein
MAKKLDYSDRQLRRGLHELEKEGRIHRIGQDRHQLWHLLKPADQDGFVEQGTPDTHANPLGDEHDRMIGVAGTVGGVAGVKKVELPRKRGLRGMSKRKKLSEKRRREYVGMVRRGKATVSPGDLRRLLALPKSQAAYWATRMGEFHDEWCEFCCYRYRVYRPGHRPPEFSHWLSTQREKVYNKLPPSVVAV